MRVDTVKVIANGLNTNNILIKTRSSPCHESCASSNIGDLDTSGTRYGMKKWLNQ